MSNTNEHLKAREKPIGVGEPAPDFTLPDQDRKEVRLGELIGEGKTVVLSFFPMAFTSVCGTEMCAFSKEKEHFEGKDATALGVSCDSFAALKAWSEKEGLRTRMLADMHRRVCRAYGFYEAGLNVASRGTVVIKPAPGDKAANGPGMSGGVVSWVSARPMKEAVRTEEVLAAVG